jgi:hypothetical protein
MDHGHFVVPNLSRSTGFGIFLKFLKKTTVFVSNGLFPWVVWPPEELTAGMHSCCVKQLPLSLLTTAKNHLMVGFSAASDVVVFFQTRSF